MFEKGDAHWLDVLQNVTKEHNKTIHLLSKVPLVRTSLKNSENKTLDRLKLKRAQQVRNTPKYWLKGLVRTADKRKFFLKVIQLIGFYKLSTKTEVVKAAIPVFDNINLLEKNNEAFLKKNDVNKEKKW